MPPKARAQEPPLPPPELPEELAVEELGDEGFGELEQHLRRCEEGGPEAFGENLDRLLSSALWRPETAQARLPTVARALLALATEIAARAGGLEDVAGVLRPGVIVMRALIRLSSSKSLDTVRARPAPKQEGAGGPGGCALMLGMLGGHVDLMTPQESFWGSIGFSTIVTVSCRGPTRLLQRQLVAIGVALREFLADGGKLVIHVCSFHGLTFFNNVIALWEMGDPPFHGLPPLRERFAGVIFECTHVPLEGWMAEPNELTDEDIPIDLEEQGDTVLIFVSNNAVATLLEKHAPEVNWYGLLARSKVLTALYKHAVFIFNPRPFRRGCFGAEMPWWSDLRPWWSLDESIEPLLPRMYLYGAEDHLFPPAAVESGLDAIWARDKRAKVKAYKVPKAGHCLLWETDAKVCTKSLMEFLKFAKIKTR